MKEKLTKSKTCKDTGDPADYELNALGNTINLVKLRAINV